MAGKRPCGREEALEKKQKNKRTTKAPGSRQLLKRKLEFSERRADPREPCGGSGGDRARGWEFLVEKAQDLIKP